MSKMPIQWHQECLTNQLASSERELDAVVSRLHRIFRDRNNAKFLEKQIIAANKSKKDGFAADLFMKTQREESILKSHNAAASACCKLIDAFYKGIEE